MIGCYGGMVMNLEIGGENFLFFFLAVAVCPVALQIKFSMFDCDLVMGRSGCHGLMVEKIVG